jgi:hypothetical protein
VKETTNTYQDFFPNLRAFGYVSKIFYQPDISGFGTMGCTNPYVAGQEDAVCSGGDQFQIASTDHIYEYKRIETEIGYRQLMTTTVKDYNQNGQNPLVTTTSFIYSTDHNRQHLLSKTMNDSKGQSLVSAYQYPNDFSTAVYTNMVSKNLINSVITETTTRAGNAVAASRKNYGLFHGFPLLSSEENQSGSGPWITSVTYQDYDIHGNLLKFNTRNGQTTSLTWYGSTDYGQTDLLNTMTTGGGSTGTVLARSTSYYHQPLVGLLTATDVNNYQTRYGYDEYNRLKTVKDAQFYLLKDINYHYANQTTLTGLGLTPTNSLNYIISRTAREQQTTTALSNAVESSTAQIQYMDGLGRPLQSQIWKGTPDKTMDLISSTSVYDTYGRAYKSILPTPSDVATGEFRTNAQSLASGFYGGDTYPYSQTVFEPSPMNRPEKMFGAGQAWRAVGLEKFVKNEYQIAGDGVIKFDLQSNGTVNCGSNYGGSTLYSQVVTSERGYLTYEVKDNEGRVSHKLQQLDDAGTLAVTGYCYDIRGNLAVVIPPEAYKKLGAGLITSFQESDEIFKELMYGYHFDKRKSTCLGRGGDIQFLISEILK